MPAAADRAASMRPRPRSPGGLLNIVVPAAPNLRFNQAGDQVPGNRARRHSSERFYAVIKG